MQALPTSTKEGTRTPKSHISLNWVPKISLQVYQRWEGGQLGCRYKILLAPVWEPPTCIGNSILGKSILGLVKYRKVDSSADVLLSEFW